MTVTLECDICHRTYVYQEDGLFVRVLANGPHEFLPIGLRDHCPGILRSHESLLEEQANIWPPAPDT